MKAEPALGWGFGPSGVALSSAGVGVGARDPRVPKGRQGGPDLSPGMAVGDTPRQ